MTLTLLPLSPAIGAEVIGLDLSIGLDEPAIAALAQAWSQHLVLLFRNQSISEDDQMRFTRYFGETGGRARPREERNEAGRTKYDETMLVSNIREDGKLIGSLPDGEMQFHSDGCYSEIPLGGTFLYAMEIPAVGGDTLFLNMCAAYDELPQSIKSRIEGRRALNAYHYGNTVSAEAEDYADYKSFVHPIVRVDPATGRKALYVNRLMTRRIEGLDERDSRALLAAIFDHIEQPQFIYAHRWTPGDLLIWDNSRTLHARTDFSSAERRLLRRTTTRGRPVTGAPIPA